MRATAAGCIQSAWRARRAERRARAAVHIQRVVRGRRGRKLAHAAAKGHGGSEDVNPFLARYAHAGDNGFGEDPEACFCCNKSIANRNTHTTFMMSSMPGYKDSHMAHFMAFDVYRQKEYVQVAAVLLSLKAAKVELRTRRETAEDAWQRSPTRARAESIRELVENAERLEREVEETNLTLNARLDNVDTRRDWEATTADSLLGTVGLTGPAIDSHGAVGLLESCHSFVGRWETMLSDASMAQELEDAEDTWEQETRDDKDDSDWVIKVQRKTKKKKTKKRGNGPGGAGGPAQATTPQGKAPGGAVDGSSQKARGSRSRGSRGGKNKKR